MKSLLSLCLTTLLIALSAPACAGSRSGTIVFTGAIINGPCDMNIDQNPVVFNCYDPASGKAFVKTADMTKPGSLTGLPVEVKMHWIDPEKNTGIIEVTYL